MTNSYKLIRESIRTNGLRYTVHCAQERGDVRTLSTIDALVERCMKTTDWLAVRDRWINSEPDAIRMTTWVTR